jgi:hypothetical protein
MLPIESGHVLSYEDALGSRWKDYKARKRKEQ